MFAEPVNICGEKILIIKWLQQKNASLHCVLEVGFELSQKIKHTPTQCILQHFYFSRNNGNFFCCLSLPETTCFAIKYLYSAICSIVLLFFFGRVTATLLEANQLYNKGQSLRGIMKCSWFLSIFLHFVSFAFFPSMDPWMLIKFEQGAK